MMQKDTLLHLSYLTAIISMYAVIHLEMAAETIYNAF